MMRHNRLTSRSYSELIQLRTFEERFEYLKLNGVLGSATFGFDRYINQAFYKSKEWRDVRRHVIIRDQSCDLGIEDRSICKGVVIHHMNPFTVDDVKDDWAYILDPEFLICTALSTHNAIHFGDEDSLVQIPKERRKGDTCPWKVY